MKIQVVYRSEKREQVHSISIYPDLYLSIIVNPVRTDSGRYLRWVEIKRKPVPLITTRMFRKTPFGYASAREEVFLPEDVEVGRVIHPLLLEPFPEELCVIGDEVLMRRRMGEKEFVYECVLREIRGLRFPLMEEYNIEVNEDKETFHLVKILQSDKVSDKKLNC